MANIDQIMVANGDSTQTKSIEFEKISDSEVQLELSSLSDSTATPVDTDLIISKESGGWVKKTFAKMWDWIKTKLGIYSSGSTGKYLNEQGDFTNITSVKDSGNSNDLTFAYSKSVAYANLVYLAGWKDGELRAVNKNMFPIKLYLAIQTGSTKQAKIQLSTLMTFFINYLYIPNGVECVRIITTSWSYADNDILQLAINGKNFELQLAGCVIEFFGNTSGYNSGVFRLRIHSSPTTSFTSTSGYTKFPVNHIAEYTCNGSSYSPTWKMLADSSETITSISRSGTTFTATRADGSTFTFDQQDNNTTYNFSGTTFNSGNSGTAEHNANNAVKNGNYYYTSNGPATSLGASTTDGALYVQSYSDSWVGQIAQDYRNGNIFVRGKNNGTWQSWKKPDAGSVNGYTVSKSVPSNAVFTDTKYSAGTGISLSGTTFSEYDSGWKSGATSSGNATYYRKCGRFVTISLYYSWTATGGTWGGYFTLPSGYRPSTEVNGSYTCGPGGTVLGLIKVATTGVVSLWASATIAYGWGCITFPVD